MGKFVGSLFLKLILYNCYILYIIIFVSFLFNDGLWTTFINEIKLQRNIIEALFDFYISNSFGAFLTILW